MSRDHMSAVRGKLAGLHQRAQAVNTAHAARGRDIAHTDHEAAHMPGTGSTGPRSSDTPDPTHNSATRPRPPAPHQLELDTLRALDAVAAYIHQLERWAEVGNSNPKERRTAASPCRGAVIHYPRPDGKVCAVAACGKPWPCKEGETESWPEGCEGTVPADSDRCTRCQLSIFHAICRSCGEVRDRRLQMKTTFQCNACAQAEWRSRQAP